MSSLRIITDGSWSLNFAGAAPLFKGVFPVYIRGRIYIICMHYTTKTKVEFTSKKVARSTINLTQLNTLQICFDY